MARSSKSIHGIFLAVELDKAFLAKQASDLLREMERVNNTINRQAPIRPKLDSKGMQDALEGMLTSLNRVKEHANNLGQVLGKLPSILRSGDSELKAQFDAIGQSLNMTGEQFKKIFSDAFKSGEIKNALSAFEGFRRSVGMSKEQIIELASSMKNMPVEVIDALKNRYDAARNSVISFKEATEEAKASLKDLQSINNVMSTSLSNMQIANQFGVSPQRAREISTAAVTDESIQKLEQYQRKWHLTDEEILKFARDTGIVGDALNAVENRFTAIGRASTQLTQGFNNVRTSISDINKANGLSTTSKQVQELANKLQVSKSEAKEMLAAMVRTTNEKRIIQFFVELRNSTDFSNKKIMEIAKNAGVLGNSLAHLGTALRRTETGFRALIRDLVTTNNMSAALQSTLAVIGVNISLAGIVELGKVAYNTVVQLDTLKVAFQSVEGSSVGATVQLEYIRKECEALGLDFMETAKAAKNFYAAAYRSSAAKDADKIFHAFTSTATALHLTKEETSGMFLALSQMMSKGKITAEELRQQLGERLPGAVQILASAMGVTTQQLDNMLQKGEVGLENLVKFADKLMATYGDAATRASHSVLAETNRLSNAWLKFKQNLMKSDYIPTIIRGLTAMVEKMQTLIPLLLKLGLSIGGILQAGRITKAIANINSSLMSLPEKIKDVSKAISSLTGSATGLGKLGEIAEKFFGLTVGQGWGAIVIAVMTAVGAFTLWNNSRKKMSEGLKQLEEDFQHVDLSGKKVVIDNVEIKTEVIKAKLEDFKKDVEDFINNRKIEFKNIEVGDAITKLAELKDEYANLSDTFTGTSVEMENYRKKLEEEIATTEKTISATDTAIKSFDDFKNSSLRLIEQTKEGIITKEEASKKFEDLSNNALKAADGNDVLKRAIIALIPQMNAMITAADALATACGGIAQMARMAQNALAALSGASITKGLLEQTQIIKNKTALLQAGVKEKTINVVSAQLGTSAKTFLGGGSQQEKLLATAGDILFNPELQKASSEAKKVTKPKKPLIMSSKNEAEYIKQLGLYNEAQKLILPEQVAGQSKEEYIAKALENKAFRNQVEQTVRERETYIAAVKGWTSAEDAYNAAKKQKTPRGGGAKGKKSAKSTVAQEKRDERVDNTIEALKKEREILEKIQRLGEENAIAKSFLEIEQATQKAIVAAQDYAVKNKESTDQAKVKEAVRLMTENAELKALNKKNKLLDEQKTKVLELISAYNKENGLPNAEGIALINQQYARQNAELDTLIENFEKLGRYGDADYVKKLKAALTEKQKKEVLFEETGVGASFKQAFSDYSDKYADVTKQMRDIWSGSLDSMGDALAEFVSSGDLSFSSLAESFHSLAKSILADMTKVMMHQFVRYFIGAIGGMFGGGSGMPLSNISSSSLSNSPNTWAGSYWSYGGQHAKGGVFGGGSLSSYTNSIVNTPTMFSYGTQRFARGGVMGEAGPEAIMPLTRTANGNLGVRAVGNGSDNVTVNVYNYGNEKARTRESRNSQGGRSIDVIIGDITAQQMTTPGTKLNRAVAAQTGASQPTIRR